MSRDDPCVDLVADCRVRAAADLFVHTWDPVVLLALAEGARRRVELRRRIGGLRDKPLTESLTRLRAHGLVVRVRVASRVDYTLTELGQTLVDGPITALGRWTAEHGAELAAAMERAETDVAT